ncbi:hypothetical protein SLEP1_g50426 [Rubroshorea leprosula]|uniref:Uncharacterized protein n=1 Tax=Rubroshorea leprosula TaxID=152421 RepID=A0AAV5LZZ9_9ROSI|nr:hypothetical protein SLEP1_g50426 [Rubroshorea leprosula]
MVEEEEKEIPLNIMEVEGNGDRCYDPNLGIVSEVREYESELGSRNSLRGLVAEMKGFLNAAGGLAILKKPRLKSKTSTVQRPERMRRSSEEVSKEVAPLQRKKMKVVEPEARGDEVVEFIPRPSPVEVDPEVREREEDEVRGPSKGKELIPPPLFQKSLFEAMNITGAKRFLNATLLEVDRSASWVNALAQEHKESVRDRANLQRQCEELQKEKEELQRKNQ